MTTIAILGAGVMGETLLAAVLADGHPPEGVVISEKLPERAAELHDRHGVRVTTATEAVRGADVVLVVVKPQDVVALLDEVADAVPPSATVVSLAAGVRIDVIEAHLPAGTAVVRAMPNTPALVGAGMFGISPNEACDESRLAVVTRLLGSGGEVVVVDESRQDAVTAVSGSGPAYVFYLAEQMIAGGVEAGLDPSAARTLTVQTLVGAARLLQSGEDEPAELRRRVTSPNGTTAAAIDAFDAAGVDVGLRAGVAAAARRSAELSEG
ncbi:pyrroline-5-carboxylate reductase [Aeromicrobium marinum DSM 15272]|uniref:Pyrroline-5-carboxylate reductase n=1 Tax=Aeromicrobium marinum DSM 15272 TaxID=585531 RepID=E2SC23_9ACTN|nr:pyrroline-5-carboxylate reductase [Aeromicrobium marinum]EFQ83309.1 pyrroline-5-carboxylate reductase [Aeromicrobium marinum DSM 15272]